MNKVPMGKVPYIERPYAGVGLTGECAYLWALFLANEADMADDIVNYDKFKSMAEQLAPKKGVAVPAAVFYPALEEEMSKYDTLPAYINNSLTAYPVTYPTKCGQE